MLEVSFKSNRGEYIPTINLDVKIGELTIGHVALVPHSPSLYEMHISSIHEDYKGAALPISRLLIKFIFNNMVHAEKLIAMIPTENRLAIALAKRSGLKLEGRLKDSIRIDGILQDQEILGICKGDL